MKTSFQSYFLLRYFFLIMIAIPNLALFYIIFTPLTVYLTYFLLSLFFNAFLTENMIIFNNIAIEITSSCVAGAAYYLLLALNLSTPKIKIKKRLKIILLSFIALLIFNVLRIFVLSLMLLNNASFFEVTHKIFWYFLSTLFVVGIWVYQIKKYKIKEIPFYSDLLFFYKKSLLNKRK